MTKFLEYLVLNMFIVCILLFVVLKNVSDKPAIIIHIDRTEVVIKQVPKIEYISLKTTSIKQKELNCLALNIYHEARGESTDGQIAVGNVTMNRVNSKKYPNSICKVVYQPSQFSWTLFKQDKIEKHDKSWIKAKKMARNIILKKERNLIGKALFYHADYVDPYWNKDMTQVAMIDQHIFYK